MEQRPPFHKQLRYERERRGWSQEDLAEMVHCDTKTVGRWERGERLPRPYLRRLLCELFGKDAEAFGLLGLMPKPISTAANQVANAVHQADEHVSPPVLREDWDEAPEAVSLYGREKELDQLERWLQDQGCRVIAVLGMGGMGKTILAAAVATQVKESFDFVFWRSLQTAPPVELLVKQCLALLSQQSLSALPEKIDDLLPLFIPYLQSNRCLLVLDNAESVMQPGQLAGRYREGYTAYGKLIRLLGETPHRSCLVLTSREKPQEVACLEGTNAPLRTLSLAGIGHAAGPELFKERGLFGSKREWAEFMKRYAGNPLALQLASGPLREVFGGSIGRFLQEDVSAFGDVRELLGQHFHRLSQEEREIVDWLAIEREVVPLEELRVYLARPMPTATLLEILDSLRRRSILETRGPARFTLQAVFIEYVTGCLIERAYQEFIAGTPGKWMSHALTRAQCKDYTRQNRPGPLLALLAQRLLATLGKRGVEQKAKNLLAAHRQQYLQHPEYLTGNLLTLLSLAGCSPRTHTARSEPQRAWPREAGTMRELVTVEK